MGHKKLYIFSIITILIMIGGVACSYLYWKDHVNGQFGLFMPVTFLIFCMINTAFKIPAVVDLAMLAARVVDMRHTGKKSKGLTACVVSVIAAGLGAVFAEFLMFWNTKGSSLG